MCWNKGGKEGAACLGVCLTSGGNQVVKEEKRLEGREQWK